MPYIKITKDNVNFTELSPRPLYIEGWESGQENNKVKTINGNIRNYVDKYNLREMKFVYENLNDYYKQIVLDFFEEYTDYVMYMMGIYEYGITTEQSYNIHVTRKIAIPTKVGGVYIWKVEVEFRDRINE